MEAFVDQNGSVYMTINVTTTLKAIFYRAEPQSQVSAPKYTWVKSQNICCKGVCTCC